MTMWTAVLLAALLCLALKELGYAVPERWMQAPVVAHTTDLLTVALLAALVAVQTLAVGTMITVDARLPALAVAAVLLTLRAPFLVVVATAAITAAVLRLTVVSELFGGWVP